MSLRVALIGLLHTMHDRPARAAARISPRGRGYLRLKVPAHCTEQQRFFSVPDRAVKTVSQTGHVRVMGWRGCLRMASP
jgi:hypothetical protein